MGKKSGNKNVYSADSGVACSDHVAYVLENVWNGLEVQNKVHRPQLPILTYEYLGSEDSVRSLTLTTLRQGAMCLLSAKTVEEQVVVRLLKEKDCKAKRSKFHAMGPNPKVSHLVFLPELGSENHHATPRRWSSSHPSCLC